ncbi:MAG: DUF6261 family protein [Tannerellaceae bacterium]|jgi:hypothetical protein|nr:DUF6261 family protein [Tannerellaceae bacterium]
MKRIKNYATIVHLLRNGEHYDFYEYINDAVKARLSAIPIIRPTWSVYYALFEKEDAIFKKSARAVETGYIKEAAAERYSIYVMIRCNIEAAAHSFDAGEKAAARRLNEILYNYKRIWKASMMDASALYTNMIEDFRQSRYVDAADKLGLTVAVCKLEKANEKFRELYHKRSKNLEAGKEMGNMRGVRVKVDKAFKLLARNIDALYSLDRLAGNDVTSIGELIDDINGTIDQSARVLSHRGRHVSKKDSVATATDSAAAATAGEPRMPERQTPESQTPAPPTPVPTIATQKTDAHQTLVVTMADPAALAAARAPSGTTFFNQPHASRFDGHRLQVHAGSALTDMQWPATTG